uniref:Phosphoribosyl pyrophosphate synthase-associated protein 2 n=1 Tax=Cairina moschata TaxID=8855 RepID=A0A8C3CTE6_CAIMO
MRPSWAPGSSPPIHTQRGPAVPPSSPIKPSTQGWAPPLAVGAAGSGAGEWPQWGLFSPIFCLWGSLSQLVHPHRIGAACPSPCWCPWSCFFFFGGGSPTCCGLQRADGCRLTHIITMDLHQKEIQGFFSFPVDNLRASPFLIQYIQEEIPDYRNAVIVAKSPDAAKRAQSYAERLRLGLAVIHGEAQCTEQDMDDGRHSPPMVKNATVHPGLELSPPALQVRLASGFDAISVSFQDDIIDDVESFVAAAEILKERGAYKIFVMATHGLLSADAPRLIEESSIDEVSPFFGLQGKDYSPLPGRFPHGSRLHVTLLSQCRHSASCPSC